VVQPPEGGDASPHIIEGMTMKYPEMFDLTGKIALVTGAATGLGAAFSLAMAEAGANVACADINFEGLGATVAAVEKSGQKAVAIRCDVTKEDEVMDMVQKTVDAFGRLDILFNNAGISDNTKGDPKPLHECTTETWNSVLAVDLQGAFYCAREALKVMVKQKSGKIINVASMWGLTGSSAVVPVPSYCAAKGAMVNLTRELGIEYAPFGINVNALCPGFYVTSLGGYSDPEFMKFIRDYIPMGREAQPKELAGAAVFLASRASDYMCGQTIVTDGGISAK
jgi:NAD(P)-dependent dehydrogenase (short-subunit alcohol dehydrogenase family)